ncbi:MAG: flippase-like domain-containing protein [Flavobacteriales bacterium]|nr:lysylphosphatidylglycerol synthase transmembrane domain-containing protein [Flavobacteriaceae bacterium]RZP07179.1 MAG: flippase-like domain-containing protein [Flavobacteriales bacterium]
MKYLKSIIPVSIGLACIYYSASTLSQDDINSIIKSFANAKYSWVFFGVILGGLSHVSRSYRWKYLLKPLGYNISFLNSVLAVFSGYLINYTIPRAGDVARGTIAYKYEGIPLEKGLGTIVAERAVDVLCISILIIIGLFINYELISEKLLDASSFINIKFLFLAGIILASILFFILRKQNNTLPIISKLQEFFKGLYEGFMIIFKLENKWLFIFHSIFIWLMYVLMFLVTTKAIAELPDLSFSIILISFILASLTIMFTPGGIGAYPLAVQLSFSWFGISSVSSLSFGWIMWTSQTLMIIIFGGLSLIILPFVNDKKA